MSRAHRHAPNRYLRRRLMSHAAVSAPSWAHWYTSMSHAHACVRAQPRHGIFADIRVTNVIAPETCFRGYAIHRGHGAKPDGPHRCHFMHWPNTRGPRAAPALFNLRCSGAPRGMAIPCTDPDTGQSMRAGALVKMCGNAHGACLPDRDIDAAWMAPLTRKLDTAPTCEEHDGHGEERQGQHP